MEKHIERCPTCGHIVSEREIALYTGIVKALWRVYKWCIVNKKHEFKRKDIKHLLLNENDSARFGDWVLFGGLVYKEKKAQYGLNMERCRDFFAGKYRIPIRLMKNPITGEVRKIEEGSIRDIPTLMTFLNEDGEYIAMYRQPSSEPLPALF